MRKKATKKNVITEKEMQKKLIEIFDRFCKRLLSEKIKKRLRNKKALKKQKKNI